LSRIVRYIVQNWPIFYLKFYVNNQFFSLTSIFCMICGRFFGWNWHIFYSLMSKFCLVLVDFLTNICMFFYQKWSIFQFYVQIWFGIGYYFDQNLPFLNHNWFTFYRKRIFQFNDQTWSRIFNFFVRFLNRKCSIFQFN